MMRRNIYNWVLIGGMALLWAACSSNDEQVPPAGTQPIQFAVSSATTPESRALITGSYLPEGALVGVFAYSYESSSSSSWVSDPDICDNEEGTASAVVESKQSVALSGDDGYYYVGGRKHAFYSYYPYQSSLTAAAPVIEGDIFADAESDGTQTDWLWAEVLDAVASTESVKLVYSHMMSLVRIAVAKQITVDATLKMKSVTLTTSDSQKFTFDISSGEVEGQDDGETEYTTSLVTLNEEDEEELLVVPVLEEEGGLASHVASQVLVLPESQITALSFEVNGELFTTPDDWKGFTTSVSGKYRLVSIVLGVEEIIIKLGGEEWVDGGDTDLSSGDVTISLGAKGWNYDPATDIDMTKANISISLGAKGWTDYSESIIVKRK